MYCVFHVGMKGDLKLSIKTDIQAPFSFHRGENDKVYEYLGCHSEMRSDRAGEQLTVFVFRVWAPRAESVFLVGDFNAWGSDFPMERISDGGVWEIAVDAERFVSKKAYKFKICNACGEFYRSDPYGIYKLDSDVSIVGDLPQYDWKDAGWMQFRKTGGKQTDKPLNIYEVHLESWKRGEDGGFLSYEELASELACYVKQMG